jgi:hypothetical protein
MWPRLRIRNSWTKQLLLNQGFNNCSPNTIGWALIFDIQDEATERDIRNSSRHP